MRGLRTFGPPPEAESLRVTEAMLPIEDYADRSGYAPGFVDPADPLPLPGPNRWSGDLVSLKADAVADGADPTTIPYTHFSVRMSASRGLPLYSAVNIDGAQSERGVERTDVWRRDPRIDARVQNLREAYGQEGRGLFSRGHMTRREDPNWGDEETARLADLDTFHVTNVAPQRQGFNAGLWLALENYVLDNADEANLKVSVITGPVLHETDPVYYNIQVPIEFWKIVVFVHGRTKQLTTIAYKRSQSEFLPGARRSRFVFGDFDDTQVSIAALQQDTGLDLSAYAPFDVFAGAGPEVEVRLASAADLYLTR